MNVLVLCTHLNAGGIATYVVNTAKYLKKRGHKIIVSSAGGDMAESLAKEEIPHIRLNIKTKSELSPKVLFSIPRVLSIIKEHDIQIIHAHTRVTQVLAHLASRLSGIPYVATSHGFFKPRISRLVFKCWGDRTIAISDAVKRHLVNDFGLPEDKIALVYNGVEVERFKKGFNETQKGLLKQRLNLRYGKVIGTIGRLSPVKGYRYLLEAFRHLLDEYKDVGLLIVGDGPEKNTLRRISKGLKIEDHVRFETPTFDTPELYSIMDIFVSSSIQEGLGLSIVEALSSGKAVVASDVGGVSSLIKDSQTGLLVRPRDSRALAGAMSRLLKDAVLRENLGKNGRMLVEKDFTIEGMIDNIEDVYTVLIKDASNPRRILIVNVNWLGDVLFSTPFIKAVRREFPTSYIACMVAPRCKEILDDNPNLDKIIVYDEEKEDKSLFGKFRLISKLKKKNFDTAFLLHRSFTKALLIFLCGIRKRVGYNTKKRGLLLTKAIKEPAFDVHKVEYFLNIAREVGMAAADKDYEFFVTDRNRSLIDKFLKEEGVKRNEPLVVLNPGGNWLPKRWPVENFARLSDRIKNELNIKTVITGAAKDLGLADEIVSMSHSKPINACGRTSIKTLAALLERADLVVSSDSGPMHLALGVKTKVIALFGPTSDRITGPYGSSGRFDVVKKDVGCPVPCYNFSCSDYKCMKAIGVDEVFEKAKEMLKDEDR